MVAATWCIAAPALGQTIPSHGEAPTPPGASEAPGPVELEGSAPSERASPQIAPEGKPPVSLAAPPVCVVEHSDTVEASDAETALHLVCAELRKRGVAAREAKSANEGTTAYVVNIRSLGELLFVDLSEEIGGEIRRNARIRLDGLEELIEGAPRLASALLDAVPIEETATSTTLTEQDTRRQRLRSSPLMAGLGVAGSISTSGGRMGGGVDGYLAFLGPRYGGGFHARITVGDTDVAHLAVFGRRYFGESNVAPFVGLALAFGRYDIGDNSDESGLAGQLQLGVEAMRFSKTRLGLVANADFPMFELGDRYNAFFGLGAYVVFGGR